jgi:hypothetical protein
MKGCMLNIHPLNTIIKILLPQFREQKNTLKRWCMFNIHHGILKVNYYL